MVHSSCQHHDVSKVLWIVPDKQFCEEPYDQPEEHITRHVIRSGALPPQEGERGVQGPPDGPGLTYMLLGAAFMFAHIGEMPAEGCASRELPLDCSMPSQTSLNITKKAPRVHKPMTGLAVAGEMTDCMAGRRRGSWIREAIV